MPSNPSLFGLPDKYWQNTTPGIEDVVIIHVCDENRKINRDFCCRRDILVHHMKYFESFLANENETGYEDIDISVHCDVEIFEWLMTYIHAPDAPPPLEKTIVVSILISSEFLQMDSLVDLCLEHIASSLSEIIKLPIDLSCISEKLTNRLAYLTQPKILSQTKDRKDKILNKLYKRRVELDFSRKAVPRGANRSMAASLTCCQYCGSVYLDSCVASLVCPTSKPAIDFRGKLVRRHQAISGWSLTGYLKALHAGGMTWELIYWHVWGACSVFQAPSGDVTISALECDRYILESDGIVIIPKPAPEREAADALTISRLPFSLDIEDDRICQSRPMKLSVTPDSPYDTLSSLDSHITPSLNPLRPPSVLTTEIFELLSTQIKLLSGLIHKPLIEATGRVQMLDRIPEDTIPPIDFYDLLWGEASGAWEWGSAAGGEEEGRGRGRSHSPAPNKEKEGRRQIQSMGASMKRIGDTAASEQSGDWDSGSLVGVTEQRRSRSSSGFRRSLSSNGRKSKSNGQRKNSKQLEKYSDDKELELLKIQQVFSSFPPDMQRLVKGARGPVCGVWIVPHPLQLHPNSYHESLAAIQEAGLPEAKRLEWELDLLREYDEKRMDKFESFLVSCRDAAMDTQVRKATLADRLKLPGTTKRREEEKVTRGEYYRDCGRQPHKY